MTLEKCVTLRGIIVIWIIIAASAVSWAGALPREVLEEMNHARSRPDEYAGYLKKFRNTFRDNLFRLYGSTFVETEEGVAAVDEAIRFLERQGTLDQLSWSPELARSAAELARESGSSGITGHYGRKSGSLQKRVGKQGDWVGYVGEIIGYGPMDARLMVMQLIIDDGVPDRGHRKNIFSRDFRLAGVECGPHPRYRNMCVIDFATGFRPSR